MSFDLMSEQNSVPLRLFPNFSSQRKFPTGLDRSQCKFSCCRLELTYSRVYLPVKFPNLSLSLSTFKHSLCKHENVPFKSSSRNSIIQRAAHRC
jgi:hypothetical protein